MDYPNKKDISFIDIYDDEVATYPRAVTYTGTVSTDSQDSKVLIADSDGDGFTTNFVEFGNNVAGFEEIRKGYYLFDGTEIRKVVGVTPSAQAITLDSPFTTSYEGLPLKVIKPILLPRVTFQNTGAVDGSIYTKTSPTDQTQYGSITLKAGDGYTFDSSTLSAFVIDSTNTTVKLSNAFFFEVGASGGGGTSYVPPYLKTGGASWSGTGLVYDVSGLEYYFNGDKLAAATQVTLDASDPDYNRLDAIVVDEEGVVSVIKGDASASPISPSVDELHILIQYILVEAGSTQPTIAKEDIYLENAEWTTSTYTTGAATGSIDFDNAVSPKQGVKCISANADARLGARFVKATSFDPYQYTMLSMWVRFTGSNVATNKSLNVRFENGAGALVANTINLFSFGLQRNLLNVWQLVVIPITSFGVLPTSVKGLKIIMAGGTVGQARQWDIDLISLTDNSVPSINEQAFNILKDGALVGQSSTINFKGAPITVTNDPINKKIDVEVIGGGDFIPLSGTEVGSPVTGDIEFYNAGEDVAKYIKYNILAGQFIFGDDNEFVSGNSLYLNDGTFQYSLSTSNQGIAISSTNTSAKGLYALEDFTANITDLAYTQKKYVDTHIAFTTVPTSSTDAGVKGQMAIDSTYLYVCVDTNTWVRTLLVTW